MIDILYLGKVVANSGLKKDYIANQMGITRQSLSYKLNGKKDFYSREITSLCDILGLSASDRNKIFFAKEVTVNSDN